MRTAVLALVLSQVAVLPSAAADLFGDRLRVNGFASQAFLRSEKNDYLIEGSTDGSFQLTEFGLTVNAKINEKLRVGGQLLSRDFGVEGNHAVKLDWGFGEYRVHQALGLRIGKVKLPIGLYNEERDLDFLRPMAFLPQGVYDELMRDFLTAGVGASAYGNVRLGDAGDLDYVVFVGELDVSDETTFVRVQKGYVSRSASELFGLPVTDYVWRSETAVAARLLYNTPVSGLRLGASYADLDGRFDLGAFGTRFDEVLAGTGIPGTVTGGFRDTWVLSGEYLSDRIELRAEFKRFRTESATFGQPTESGDTEAWYAMGTFRIPGADQVAITAVYDYFERYRDREHDPANGRHNEKKDFGAGLRWDVSPGFALKAEYHTVRGAGSVFDTWGELNRENGLQNDWGYFIAKASFAF